MWKGIQFERDWPLMLVTVLIGLLIKVLYDSGKK